MNDSADKWNQRYASAPLHQAPAAAWVLTANAHLLPRAGDALDLACGLGGNALWLAHRGWRTSAWDLSEAAIDRLRQQADRQGVAVEGEVRDAADLARVDTAFDVIVVTHFLDRAILPYFADALRPGGLLFYQTFTTERPPGAPGPTNPAFLLRPGELLERFAHWRVLFYREDGLAESAMSGLACLVARNERA